MTARRDTIPLVITKICVIALCQNSYSGPPPIPVTSGTGCPDDVSRVITPHVEQTRVDIEDVVKKVRSVQKISEHLYQIDGSGSSPPTFVLERIDDSNYGKWFKYAKDQKRAAMDGSYGLKEPYIPPDLKLKYGKVFGGALDGLDPFQHCLESRNRGEVWVAYVTHRKTGSPYEEKHFKDVEMAMAVLTSNDRGFPFELHMGISRNLEYLLARKEPTQGLAAQLHAMVALTMLDRDSAKKYVITTPLASMEEIFKKTLPKESYYVGHNQPDSLIQTQHHKAHKDFQFRLMDHESKKIIFETDEENAQNKYHWFFANIQAYGTFSYWVIDLKKLSHLFQ